MDATEQITRFKEFFETHYEKDLAARVQQERNAIGVDFNLLAQHDIELAEKLIQDPENLIKAAELTLEQFDFGKDNTLKRVRIKNLPDSQGLKIANIRSKHLDKFIRIEGIVRQASEVRPQVTTAKFECPSCGNTLSILQLEAKFREPTRCSCGRRGKFRLLQKELVDAQHLKIEESPENLHGGEQPKRLSIFLREDLVEPLMEKKCSPGSKIQITGVIKEVPVMLKTGAQSVRFDLVMEANHVEPVQEDFEDIILTKEDIEEIEEFAKDDKVFDKLATAVAPSIYGYEKIKRALVLQMFSGTRKIKKDGTIRRGDIHILLIGDPGCGKSQLLQFISKAAPKARFVSGKGSSGAGLTASVVKDEFLKGWSLEAGALVLANKGLVAVDELDKMSEEDRSALHEALEQQTITISKANIQATLRAETTMLAAANPKFSRFDPFTPIASQIELPASLINRFDLIFTIRDIPDEKRDTLIATHVLETTDSEEVYNTGVTKDFLRKYLAYAKRRIRPKLTKVAIQEIKNFYVRLRNSAKDKEGEVKAIPISARQLEALVRLAEASAKVRLDEKVTRKDAKIAIELLQGYMMEVGYDHETGTFDIDRVSTGMSTSTRNKIITIRNLINELESRGMKQIPLEEVMALAAERGIEEDKVDEAINKLKRSGDIFEPKKGFIQKI